MLEIMMRIRPRFEMINQIYCRIQAELMATKPTIMKAILLFLLFSVISSAEVIPFD
jgi:hypothetical protein